MHTSIFSHEEGSEKQLEAWYLVGTFDYLVIKTNLAQISHLYFILLHCNKYLSLSIGVICIRIE